MGLYRDQYGAIFEVDDRYAATHGYEPVTPGEESAAITQQAMQQRAEETGILGDIRAGGTRLASGLSLGTSDLLLDYAMSDPNKEQLLAEIEARPYISTGGEIAGSVLGALAAPGSALARTPAGFLGATAARGVEAGLARGGIAGTAQALGAMGVEGALQNAGSYIGMSALADRELTAEGLGGALGTGFAFSGAAGAAGLGIAKGAMAARKLYSRTLDGTAEAVKDAEIAWTKSSDDLFAANDLNVSAAKAKLEEINAAKRGAAQAVKDGKVKVYGEQSRAADIASEPKRGKFVPERPVPMPEKYGPSEFQGPLEGPRETYAPDELFVPQTANDVVDETITVVPASVLKDHGFESLSVPGRDVVKTDKARQAITEGQRDPIKIAVSPNGKYIVEDGTHRLAAAIEQNKPIKVQWFKGSKGLDEPPPGPAGEYPSIYHSANDPYEVLRDQGFSKEAIMEMTPEQAQRLMQNPADRTKIVPRPDLERTPALKDSDIPFEAQAYGKFATLGEELPWEHAFDDTKKLFGAKAAKEEAELMEALEEFQSAKTSLMDKLQMPNAGPDASVPRDFMIGNPKGAAFTPEEFQKGMADVGTFNRKRTPAEREMLEAAPDLEAQMAGLRTPEVVTPTPRGEFEPGATPDEGFDLDGPSDVLAEDVARLAPEFERYEKASIKLTEALGEEAHPSSLAHAEAFAKAEADSERKILDRVTREAEDLETFGPYEFQGPKNYSPSSRVKYAKDRLGEARLEYSKLDAQAHEAKTAYDAAVKTRDATPRPEAPEVVEAPTPGKKGRLSRAADAAGVAEWIDIPGMPKASDIPVIGPLLGAYLKYRTAKSVTGKFAGRIGATPDNKVIALAAKTRERFAKAVDAQLAKVTEKVTGNAMRNPRIGAILATRIFDDGGEVPKKDAPITEQAAARMREVQAYVSTPGAIERDVRRELRGVTDPDLILAAEKQRRAAMQHLADNMPKIPEQTPLQKNKWLPSPGQAMSFARRLETINDPAAVMEAIAHERSLMTLENAQAMRAVYPKLFQLAQLRMLEQSAQIKQTVPYRKRMEMSAFYDVPLDSSLQPDNVQIIQSAYERRPEVPPGAPTAPPTPSVAGPTNLTALYQTSVDRRAQ